MCWYVDSKGVGSYGEALHSIPAVNLPSCCYRASKYDSLHDTRIAMTIHPKIFLLLYNPFILQLCQKAESHVKGMTNHS